MDAPENGDYRYASHLDSRKKTGGRSPFDPPPTLTNSLTQDSCLPPPKSYSIEAWNRRGCMGRAKKMGLPPDWTNRGFPSSRPLLWNAFNRSRLNLIPAFGMAKPAPRLK